MDGTGEYYAKWNKPGGERQIPYNLTYKGNLMNKTTNKQNKTRGMETGTDGQWLEGLGEGNNGRKKGKGLVKEHV